MFRRYLIAAILLLITAAAMAQTYLPVTITGYNSDLFAETAPIRYRPLPCQQTLPIM